MAEPQEQGTAVAEAESDEVLATRMRVAVTRLNRRLRQQSLAGLSPAQASVLGTVGRLGAPTLGELALAEQVQPPTMTRLVDSMKQSGLLTRDRDRFDGRIYRVKLTGEGRRALQRVRLLKNAFLRQRLAELGPSERATAEELIALLERLVDAP